MSAWSGVAVAAIALVIVGVAVAQPLWEWRLSDANQVDTWSYGLLGVTHTIVNKTLRTQTNQTFSYLTLPNQPRIAALFASLQLALFGVIAGIAAGMGLSIATIRRKLRGLYAGTAFAGASVLALLVPLLLVLNITVAAEDLPQVGGTSLPSFEGSISGSASLVLRWGPGMSWYILLGLCIVFAFGASEVWSLRPRSAAKGAVAQSIRDPPAPEPPAPEHPEPVIEEVFVIGSNGLLIKHMSRSLMSDKDRDVVGGMISVLSNFVRETFSERDGNDVQEVSLGDHRFILCNERGIVVAVLVTQGATEDIVPRLRHLLACLIDRYADKLDRWGGEALDGIEDEIQVLWQPFFLPPPPAD